MFVCSEVLEHVLNPVEFIRNIESGLKDGARVMFSTPHGPWEEHGRESGAQVEHISHFEESDIKEMFKGKDSLSIFYNHAFENDINECFGHYVYTYISDQSKPTHDIDYNRKHRTQAPKQKVSMCMIVKGDSETLGKTFKTAQLYVDEFIVGIDSDDLECNAAEICERYGANYFLIGSPMKQGFAESRNQTLARATGEWIVWMDDDEFSVFPNKIVKYFKNNLVNGYAVPQHHFSCEPAGLIKTDNPCRS